MPSTSARPLPRRRLAAAAAVAVVVPLAVAGCSSSSSQAGPTTTITETVSPSPTDTSASPTDSPTSPTSSPTDSPTSSPSPTGSPSTITPSPTGAVKGITIAYSPTKAAANQRVSITATTDASLAGKLMYTVKTNDGAPKVLGSGVPVRANGTASSYVQLLRTGVLIEVVPVTPIAVGPYDPSTPLLASSAPFTVTVG